MDFRLDFTAGRSSSFINSDDVVVLLQKLVSFPSVNPLGQEAGIASFIRDFLVENGIEARLIESLPGRPSVLGIIDSGLPGPSLLFAGHIDVVPVGDGWTVDPFAAEVRGDKLYGRGAADMKGGLAAMLAAAAAAKRSCLPACGRLLILAASDEEVAATGARSALQEDLRADCAIVPEPSEMKVVVAHKGVVHFVITTHGSTAHASCPELGVNAIDGMVRLLNGLYEYRDSLAKVVHPLLGSPTLNIGTIVGGTLTNIVADRCRVTVDRRLLPAESVETALNEMREALCSSTGIPAGLTWDITYENESPPMEIGVQEPIVGALRQSVVSVTGFSPEFVPWPATSDAGILQQEGGIPSVIFGPGSLEQAHKPDEWVSVPEVVEAAAVFLDVISRFPKSAG